MRNKIIYCKVSLCESIELFLKHDPIPINTPLNLKFRIPIQALKPNQQFTVTGGCFYSRKTFARFIPAWKIQFTISYFIFDIGNKMQ